METVAEIILFSPFEKYFVTQIYNKFMTECI